VYVSDLVIGSLAIYGDPLNFFRELFDGCGDQYDERETLIKKALCGQCSVKLIEVLPGQRPRVAKKNMHMFFYYGDGIFHVGRDVHEKIELGYDLPVLGGNRFSLEVEEGKILKGIVVCQRAENVKKKDPRYFASK
jgi:hypothetical protein